MNALLEKLGVSAETQAFFQVSDPLSFSYGDNEEQYGEGFHKVPTTRNLWVAGNGNASNVIITYSAMEAIAFISLNCHRYPHMERLAFVAIGNRIHSEQIGWIRQKYPGRRFTLVFGKDLLGRITDIKLAAGIKNIPIRIFYANQQVIIYGRGRQHTYHNEQLSLHTFQEDFCLRPRLRTGKPIQSLTFLNQLKNDAER